MCSEHFITIFLKALSTSWNLLKIIRAENIKHSSYMEVIFLF